MSDIFDYLKWRGDLSFSTVPMCEVDALIFAELSYVDLGGYVPSKISGQRVSLKNAARRYFDSYRGKEISLGKFLPDSIITLLRAAAESKRFSETQVFGYRNVLDEEQGKQFCAITFLIDDGTYCVTFRGTDDSILGWKEDFRMSFRREIPAQTHALRYLERIALANAIPTGRKMVVCGHSKGGNLAVWSAIHAPKVVRDSIKAVYNFDGPGFLYDVKSSEGYRDIEKRLHTVVPECSIVGMFFYDGAHYRAVKSSARGLYQHDAMSWLTAPRGFVSVADINLDYKKVNKILSRWIANMNDSEREAVVEAFFKFLYSTKATTLTELASDSPALWKAFMKADADTVAALKIVIKAAFAEIKKR
jgi:hypothetical protein